MSDTGYKIIDEGDIVRIRIPYGDHFIAFEIIGGKVRFPAGWLHLDAMEELGKGLLAAAEWMRLKEKDTTP